MSEKKYYPLAVIESQQQEYGNKEASDFLLTTMKTSGFADESATEEELYDYVFGSDFFSPEYDGKFKKYNDMILFDKDFNRKLCPHLAMDDIQNRIAECKDLTATALALQEWTKAKMVYKIDHDFFHEIKQTENLIITEDLYKNIPYKCLFIDLTEVKDISGFKGIWVLIHKDKKTDGLGVNIFMCREDDPPMFFTHYSWFIFGSDKEIKITIPDLPNTEFLAHDLKDESFRKITDEDIRPELTMATFQILQFIAMDASDIAENETTKRTYKPAASVKNKFSEVRMWDVGVRYGKAIRIAKNEYKKQVSRNKSADKPDDTETKTRKPTRPHVRRAHWHRFRTGKGRVETTTLWIAPIYVCGNGKEIPVTIHEIKR